MSRDQLLQKAKDERRKRLNAEARERRLRTKSQNELIEMDEEDHNDIETIFDSIDSKYVPPDMEIFWEHQIRNSRKKQKSSYRLHPK